MSDMCPQCGKQSPTITFTCNAPSCLKSRFCCYACVFDHIGTHFARIAALEAENARLREDYNALYSVKAGIKTQQALRELVEEAVTVSARCGCDACERWLARKKEVLG